MTEHDYSIESMPNASTDDTLPHRAMLAKIRHDLRTPINAIIGYGELRLEDARDAAQDGMASDLEKIVSAGRDLLAVVDTILHTASVTLDGTNEPTARVDFQQLGEQLRHAILTPATTVMGLSELVLEDAAVQEDTAWGSDIERIHSSAIQFLTLVDDLLQYQEIAQGHAAAQYAAHVVTPDASAMVAQVVTTIRAHHTTPLLPWSQYGPVLVVDDNEMNRSILARRLEREGLRVATSAHGRDALERLRVEPFDLVLLDIMMPEINGIEVLQRMKADATLRDIPVIMISALDEIASVVRCLEMGAEEYLSKPFNPVVLYARIGACLEKKRLRDLEIAYLRNVAIVTSAAGAVEAGQFDPASLAAVADREDELGQLARVFQHMAREVAAREQRLKQQVEALRIEIDEAKKQQQVAEIAESDAFHDVLERARQFRAQTK